MTSEDEIKRKMLQQRMQQQMMEAQQEAFQQQMQMKQMEETLKIISKQILTPAARQRLANVKLVKPEIAMQLEVYLAQLYQSGQLRDKITEAQLIEILKKVQGKRDFRIKRVEK
jgi:programmed cell death protein 5